MYIRRLFINNFRNIEWMDFEPSSEINLIFGPNGSGKTSLLESISYLALCRSFRSSRFQNLIANDKSGFIVSAKVISDDNLENTLGISRNRSRSNDLQISIDKKRVYKLVDLVDHICVQIIHPQGIDLITGSPETRRHFIDWGVYFINPEYKNIWSEYKKILSQRNILLKKRASEAEIIVWDDILCQISEKITALRADYLKKFIPIFRKKIEDFLPGFDINISLSKGWDNGIDIRSLLSLNLEKDRLLGYTFYGCHRADLKIKTSQLSASETLSRGQLKLLMCAMKLSQGTLLYEQTGRRCIYLIDDFTSELDHNSREALLKDLSCFSNQVFITNIAGDIDLPSHKNILRLDISKSIQFSA